MINLKEAWEWSRHYREQRRRWREAQTVEQLGRLGAAWARGELGAHPFGYDVPDPETEPLRPVLALANEAGFFTYQSQPGGRWEEPEGVWEQRAFVDGYLARSELLRFREYLEGAGMVVLDSMPCDEVLTRLNGEPQTSGSVEGRADSWFTHISSAARSDMADAADLFVYDPVWCRENALWTALEAWGCVNLRADA